MARKVFFSFHYERDIWRAGQVRNSWVTKLDRQSAGFWDSASWEAAKKKGTPAVEAWIRKQLVGTSVTVVLIGPETADREYVLYEINQSWARGNGLIGVYIHKMKDRLGKTETKGASPFNPSVGIQTYDWVGGNGYENLGTWVEAAYQQAQQRNKQQSRPR